jgi:acetyl/propionyl-CoA carboxylase alpha subunit
VSGSGLSAADLDDVLTLLAGTDIVEFEVTVGETHLRLRRDATLRGPTDGLPEVQPAREAVALAVVSPLVGIFHPAVVSGQQVEAGQSLGAITALGLPTNVDAPQAGTIEELLIEADEPVEYGQPLLILRRAGHAP